LRAGSARRDITQPLGTPAGLSLTALVDEVWDPLTATVVVLEQAGARAAIVGLDLVGVLEASHRAIRSATAVAAAVPEEHVVVVASHTHSAPYLSAELQELLRPHGLRIMDDAYADDVVAKVGSAAAEAAEQTVPVTVQVGRAPVERVASNRRPRMPDGRVVHRYGRPPGWMRRLPEGSIDPDVATIRLTARNGATVAIIASYACHPTAAGGDNHGHVSADFVGYGRERIEHATGAPCVFLQGCAGNIGTGKWVGRGRRADTLAMGRRFARGALQALADSVEIAPNGLAIASGRVALELEPLFVIGLERDFERAVHAGDAGAIVAAGDALVVARRIEELRQATVKAFLIGGVALVVLPGEVFVEHGLSIRKRSPFSTTVVAAYQDNTLQYIPTAAAFEGGEYEVTGGWRYIEPGEGERLADEAVSLLGDLAAEGR
jgi:neutral/alkaline ceramidase-like enzyme